MASEKNLSAVFTDIANSIRSKKGTTGAIQPINMASEIDGIQTGGDEKSVIYRGLEAMGTNWSNAFSSGLFSKITEISEKDIPLSSSVTNMSYMFNACQSLEAIPDLDTSNVTDMSYMFQACGKLKAIPQLDTSKVTNMTRMFYNCYDLESIPQLDTSKVTNMSYLFASCYKLKAIPELDTSKVTNMSYMFSACKWNLVTIPRLDTSKVTNMKGMFNGCGQLTTIPALNTSNVTNMDSMFKGCSSLTTIPQLDTSSVKDMSFMFRGCGALTAIYMKNIKVSLNISGTALQHDALVELLNNGLATVTTTQTLTLGDKLALLSDSEKKVALDKGWTLI